MGNFDKRLKRMEQKKEAREVITFDFLSQEENAARNGLTVAELAAIPKRPFTLNLKDEKEV